MSAIIKTLPTFFARGHIRKFLTVRFARYYFTLGRGRPRQAKPTRLYFTHQGVLLGYFDIEEVVQNVGQLPKLTTLDGRPSAWQIKPDAWVAVCFSRFHFLRQKLYHEGFRGWRYFDFETYRQSLEAKVNL